MVVSHNYISSCLFLFLLAITGLNNGFVVMESSSNKKIDTLDVSTLKIGGVDGGG